MNTTSAYNAAIRLHNHELSVLSGRNNAFAIVQSILIVAFVILLVNRANFPLSFDIIGLFTTVFGLSYVLIHHRAGLSAAIAGFRWRQYLVELENNQDSLPMSSFHRRHNHTHNVNWWSELKCEACLLERLPLPSAWLFTPSIFLFWWLFACLYVVFNYAQQYIRPELAQYHQSPLWLFILLGVFTFLYMGIAIGIISVSVQRWWHRQV